MDDWDLLVQHCSWPRLQHYLATCDGDRRRAAELYEWNVAVSAACWESLSYLEVALRNTLDDRMQMRHSRLGRSGHWVFDDARELGRDGQAAGRHRQPYVDIDGAKRRVRNNHKPLDPGQVISELSFGFWHQLVSRKQTFLWPDLAGGFPHAPDRAQATVSDPVRRLRAFRNRIGHHHRIWSGDIQGHYTDVLTIAGYIDPDLQAFISRGSRVPALLRQRP